MYGILEYPGGPALCVGYRTRTAADAALERLRNDDSRYVGHVVERTDGEDGFEG